MSAYRPSTTFSNPVTKAGRVVYNVTLDMSHAAYRLKPASGGYQVCPNVESHADEDTLTVQPHEICLEQDKKIIKRSMTRSVNDTEILLLSALNGLKVDRSLIDATQPEKTRRLIRQRLKFGGVASTMAKYDPNHRTQNDQVFVSQFGGLCTIQNTGSDPIRAGDYVVWDLPRTSSEGKVMCGKKEKQMVITRPYNPKDMSIESLKRRLGDPGDELAKAVLGYKTALKVPGGKESTNIPQLARLTYEITEVIADEKGRIIGRAMSNADEAGDTFDILLGRYAA
tara:strand:- start:2778 stop:3626 length:849 start_codon:yes stop_codon:yes gene_type:complete